jgi:GTP-binding protein
MRRPRPTAPAPLPGRQDFRHSLKVLSAEFVTSAAPRLAGRDVALARGGPAPGLALIADAEVALVGRSNVGKSSLINALARQRIARTSAAPGKTRLANFYRLTLEGGSGPGRWDVCLVDLPGYGYARGGKASAAELQSIAEGYFTHPRRPDAVLLCVDSRHPGLEPDLQAAGWLATLDVTAHLVATKVDKLSRAERVRNVREMARTLGTSPLAVSATTGEGLEDVWKLIVRLARSRDRTKEER